jgi:LPXTG-motif cell wall-anchored protein
VNVDNTVKTSLSPTTSEQRYVKVGDKVQEQGTTELKWTATNADSVKIDPLGVVTGAGGSPTIQISPEKNSPGPVDETHTYKITATNICGGSATSVATVHLTGSIGPEQVAAAEPPPELPNTASPLPLVGLTGLLFLGTGSILKRRRMK